MTTYYKFLASDRTGGHTDYTWPALGEWAPKITGKLVRCQCGYHILNREQLLGDYIQSTLFEVGAQDVEIVGDDKCVCRSARLVKQIETWNDRTARLFACDCAERVLPIWYKAQPNDQRPWRAIETARRFVRGEATQEELDAAGAAAWDAAWAAARDAAGAAARAAARAAAGAAAWAAARAAAGDAARAAAWAAAGDAARAAAGAAARAAARDAERKWQRARLDWYLFGGDEPGIKP